MHPMKPARMLTREEVARCTLGLGALAAASAVQRQFAAVNGIQIGGTEACPAAADMGGNWCGDRGQCMEHCGSAIGGVLGTHETKENDRG